MSPLLKLMPSSRAGTPAGKIFFPNSPCPSPTPFFQKIYMALSNFDRLSPEVVKLLPRVEETRPLPRRNSFASINSDSRSPSYARRLSYPLGKPNIRITTDEMS